MTQMNDVSVPYNQSIPLPTVRYAGFWIRVGASLIDSIILIAVLLVVMTALPTPSLDTTGMDTATANTMANMTAQHPFLLKMQHLGIWPTLFGLLYETLFVASKWQATPGKIVVGIYVMRSSGAPCSILTALGRALCRIISSLILGIGYLMVAFTKQKTGLHDLMVDTRVVYGQPAKASAP
jgi:uncharacterized RDD family membrane protein YckC